MAPVPTPPPPGSMTVPPYFGWEHILIVLVLVVAAAVAFLALGAARGTGVRGRNEWQAALDARSRTAAVPGDDDAFQDSGDGADLPGGPSGAMS